MASWTTRRRRRQDRVGRADPHGHDDLPALPAPGGRARELLGPEGDAQLPAARLQRRQRASAARCVRVGERAQRLRRAEHGARQPLTPRRGWPWPDVPSRHGHQRRAGGRSARRPDVEGDPCQRRRGREGDGRALRSNPAALPSRGSPFSEAGRGGAPQPRVKRRAPERAGDPPGVRSRHGHQRRAGGRDARRPDVDGDPQRAAEAEPGAQSTGCLAMTTRSGSIRSRTARSRSTVAASNRAEAVAGGSWKFA